MIKHFFAIIILHITKISTLHSNNNTITEISLVVRADDKVSYIYTGFLESTIYGIDGVIEEFIVKGVRRRKLTDDKINNNSNLIDDKYISIIENPQKDRYVTITSDMLFIKYSDVSNYSITFQNLINNRD